MKRDPNNPEELRREILLRVDQGEVRPWPRRAANTVMRIAGHLEILILTTNETWWK